MSESRKQARGRTNDYFTVYDRETGEPIGRLRNLTIDGAMLISEAPVAVPAVVQCRMRLPDIIEGCREIFFDVESRWCQENKNAYWHETGYHFTHLSDLSRRVIGRLMRDWMSIDKGSDSRESAQNR